MDCLLEVYDRFVREDALDIFVERKHCSGKFDLRRLQPPWRLVGPLWLPPHSISIANSFVFKMKVKFNFEIRII